MKSNFDMSNEEYYNTFMQLRKTIDDLKVASSISEADWRKNNRKILDEIDFMIDKCNFSSMHWHGNKDDNN